MMDPDAFLAHYGKKGMKWGVINDDDPSPEERAHSKSKNEYKSVPEPKLSDAQKKKNLIDSHKKSMAKLQPSEEPKKRKPLTPQQKELITWGVLAGIAAAAVIGYSIYAKKLDPTAGIPKATFDAMSRKDQFQATVKHSQIKSWITGYVKPSSYDRPAFELPVGHVFTRLSTSAEKSFGHGTYATASVDDFNRYVTNFRHELSSFSELKKITFTAKAPVKVPDLTTTLDTLKEVMAANGSAKPSATSVLIKYQELSGGKWLESDKYASGLFKSLAAKGYGAIVDEMDAGVIGENPLVVFATDKLTEKVSTPITPGDIISAEANVKLILNRK